MLSLQIYKQWANKDSSKSQNLLPPTEKIEDEPLKV